MEARDIHIKARNLWDLENLGCRGQVQRGLYPRPEGF